MSSKRMFSILLSLLAACTIWSVHPTLEAQSLDGARLATHEGESSNITKESSLVEKSMVANRSPRTNIKIVLRADSSSLKPGDELRFTVKTDRDCYLTLLYSSPQANKVMVLWPNQESGWNNRVRANIAIRVPGPGSSIHLKVDGRSPYERILAVASSKPDAFLGKEDYVEETGRPVRILALRSSELLERLRDRAERLANTTNWGTAQLTVHVASARSSRDLFVSSLSPKHETVLTVKRLNDLIAQKGYHWTAGVTSVSELSDQEFGILCGDRTLTDKNALRGHLISKEEQAALDRDKSTRPTKWDWRDVNGQDWTTPIREQLSCGSCSAFATAAVVEINSQIFQKKAHSGIQLSPGHLFFCGCGRCCGTGWQIYEALEFVKYEGLLAEADYPYRPINQDCGRGLCPSSGDGQSKTKISEWKAIPNTEDAKTWLSQHGPLATSMVPFTDFLNYKTGVYKPTTNEKGDGHAIAIVGYDDDGKFWICKNHWGTGWGENGWFKIEYGQCEIGSRAPFFGVEFATSRN